MLCPASSQAPTCSASVVVSQCVPLGRLLRPLSLTTSQPRRRTASIVRSRSDVSALIWRALLGLLPAAARRGTHLVPIQLDLARIMDLLAYAVPKGGQH